MSGLPEAEARTKWCPFARFVIDMPGFASGNRFEDGPSNLKAHSLCIASECMAWRRAPAEAFDGTTGEALEPRRAYLAADIRYRETGAGFCGLVGRPS